MSDEFLTVDDVAALFKLNPQTIRNWIDRGELRAIRIGPRRVRVLRSDLDAFIATSTTAGRSRHEADEGESEELSTAEALAEVRSQLDAAEGESDASKVADALALMAESVRALADRIKRSQA